MSEQKAITTTTAAGNRAEEKGGTPMNREKELQELLNRAAPETLDLVLDLLHYATGEPVKDAAALEAAAQRHGLQLRTV